MKKTLLAVAFLVLSTVSFSGFAAEEEAPKEITFGELCKDGLITTVQLLAAYEYFLHVHDRIAPANDKSPEGKTFDIANKAFVVALCWKSKIFFEKVIAYFGQKVQPVQDVLSEAMEIA